MTEARTPVHVIDDALPPAAMQAAYDTFKSSDIQTSTHFVGTDDPAGRLCEVMPIPVALLLARYLDRVGSEALALGYQRPAVWELWVNRVGSLGPNVFLHVDNDEKLRAATGEVSPPEFGSILYLGPEGDISGGETLIAEDEPSDELGDYLFKHVPAEEVQAAVGENVATVAPRRGRACIFRGSLAHCVLPFGELPGGPRVTFLANGWVNPPTSASNGS